jgi:hypothetical protein
MKFLRKVLVAFVAFSACIGVCLFTACNDQLSGEMKVVVCNEQTNVTKEYSVDLSNFTSSQHVDDVIKYLTSNADLYYSGTTSVYGIYITEMGTSTQVYNNDYQSYQEVKTPILTEVYGQNSMDYVTIYTSNEDDTAMTDTKQYGDVTLGWSSFGISSMHLKSGSIIYFTMATYAW